MLVERVPTLHTLGSSSVLVLARNIPVVQYRHQNSPNKRELAATPSTAGSLWRQVRIFFPLATNQIVTWGYHVDSMIDFGFVISAFVPLVLFWM